MELVGLDGCKGGAWIAARRGPKFELVSDLCPLLERAAVGEAMLVLDVPIGLIDDGRRCDAEARVLLRQRRSSVFTPPTRAALPGRTRDEASRLNVAACGKKIGCQSFGILSRIRNVDLLMTPERQQHVREGHPEVSFAVLAGHPMDWAKQCAEGRLERVSVLRGAGIDVRLSDERARLKGTGVASDDILDAAAMLATAIRIADGTAIRLPRELSERDERGLLAEMWA